MKPFAIVLSGAGKDVGGDNGHNLTNAKCKAIGKWHNESPLFNECMLIKIFFI
jgi:hypothetical protein